MKHGWNEEKTRDELLKHDPESDDKPATTNFFGSRPGFSGVGRVNGTTIYRVTSSQGQTAIVRNKVLPKVGGVRRGSSGSEDDDYGVRKGKDDRVYDR